ncbi:hypothetical protein ACE6H2_018832 [Prunus campanulata]
MSGSTIKIAKNTFDSNPMSKGRLVHKLADVVHSKGNIRACESEILQSTNDTFVLRGIIQWNTIMEAKTTSTSNRR